MKKAKKLFKIVSLLMAAIMMFGIFAACGGGKSETATTTSGSAANAATETTAKTEPPTEISILSLFWTPEPPAEDNPIQKEIEKRTNTKLTITWATNNNFQDKRNVILSSGDIPDLMFVDDPFAPEVQGMEAQGAFWDITPYLKDLPNLMKFPETTWKYIKSADGKTYGVPRVRPTDGNVSLMLRQDWLDALSLKAPVTTDDLYAVLKAFAEKDPDGNKQQDTVGLTGFVTETDLGNFNYIEGAFTGTQSGGGGNYGLKDGKLVDFTLEDGQRQAIEYLAKLYKEGLLPKDLLVLKPTQGKDLLLGGKAGALIDGMNQAWRMTEELRKTTPNADMLVVPYLQGPSGIKYSPRSSGFYGKYVIPKTVDEEKMKKILAFMDYGASDEGSDLANYGLKDVHYTEQNGFKIPTEQAKTDNVTSDTFGQIFNKFNKYFRAYAAPTTPPEKVEAYKKVIDAMSEVSIENPAVGLFSDTNVKLGSEYRKTINDMKLKVISGKEPIASWDALVAKLKGDAEYQKIIQEMAAAYEKRNAAK